MISEENRIKYKKSIQEFCLMDDTFMAVVFGNELQLSEMLLHTIMGNDKIRVITSTGQYAIKSLQAHSSTLDIFCQDELGRYFKDGSHIIYVNGEKRYDNTELSMLMHDFFCKDAKDVKNAVLADRVRHFKEEESGVEEMCEIMQKLANDAAYEKTVEIAKGLLGDGISVDIVSKNTKLPREEVEAMAKSLGKLIA